MAQWNESDHPRDNDGKFTDKGVSSSEFFGAVMDLTMDRKTERMRFKFGDGGVAELVQVSKPLDEE